MAYVGDFDTEGQDLEVGTDPVPPGKYTMIVSNSDLKFKKDSQTDKFVAVEHTIVEGPYKDRKVFQNFSLWHTNDFGRKLFGQLVRACGKMKLQSGDTAELHGIPFVADVTVRPAKDGYRASNAISEYVYEGANANSSGQRAASEPVQAGNVPWANG